MKETKNHKQYKRTLLSEVSPGDLIHASDMIGALLSLFSRPNEIIDDAEELQRELDKKAVAFRSGNLCPHCHSQLYLSDLPQYNETCYVCDENF